MYTAPQHPYIVILMSEDDDDIRGRMLQDTLAMKIKPSKWD